MPATASRLGNSSLTFDWTHLLRSPIHPAFKKKPSNAANNKEKYLEAWNQLKKQFDSQEVGFYDAPIKTEISQIEASESLAHTFLKKNCFTDCLVLGIGGSCLGPMSLLSALEEKKSTQMKFHFLDNPDPLEWKSTLKKLNPHSTLVCAITKSGNTFETLAQLLLALEWLGKELWKKNLVIITDPEKGDLRAFAHQEEISCLSITPSIGGRFSIFTPVGLFPAALAGLSIRAFLKGAQQIREAMEKLSTEKNPLFIIADQCIEQAQKRTLHVCMPYSSRLKAFGSWFVQLWAESLGKEGKGFTPIAALGATDQHSLLQLLRDGPDDKITFFLTIDQINDGIKIPSLQNLKNHLHYPGFQILENHSLKNLLDIEYQTTAMVLTKKERPHISIKLDHLDEGSLGSLYFTFSILTSFTGTLWGINPFNQPGVQEAKQWIHHALSQKQEPKAT